MISTRTPRRNASTAKVVRDEIGVGNADDRPRGRDRNQQHQARAIRSFPGRAFEGLAKMFPGRFDFRKILVAVQQLGAGLEPVVHEGLLQLRDRGAFHLIMRIAPQTSGAAIAPPVIRDADAANKSELSIDDQDLAMRPEIDGGKVDEAKNLDVHSRAPQETDGATAHAIGAECVLKEMHCHAGARAFCQRLRELIGDVAFPEEKILEGDGLFGGANGAKHGGEDFVAVLQRRDFVSFEQRRPEHVAHRSDEGVVARVVIRGDAIANFLFCGEEISRDKKSGETARSGCAEQLGPLRWFSTKWKLHCNSIEGGRRFDCPRK
jgi:hypothetical protein